MRQLCMAACVFALAHFGFSAGEKRTVVVQFTLDADGTVIDPKVTASDEPLLNPYAIAMVRQKTWDAAVLPAEDEAPKLIESPLSFPVDEYEGNVPLPVGATPPEPVKRVPPRYPFECRINDLSGGVLLALTIGTNGKVRECKVIAASHEGFAREAIKAFKQWKFKPATLDETPFECTVNIAVPFQLEGQQSGWRWLLAPAPRLRTVMIESERHPMLTP